MGLGPFELAGGPFLALYLVLLVGAALATIPLAGWLRPHGRAGYIGTEDELAALAGGRVRVAEAATVRLLANGQLVQQDKKHFVSRYTGGGDTATERAILGAARHAPWSKLQSAASDQYPSLERRLIANGLLMDRPQRLWQQLLTASPLLMVLGFGAIKLMIGLERDKPVGFLAMLLAITGLLIVVRMVRSSPATHEGLQLIAREKAKADRIRRAPQQDEMGTSVALFGTAVLAGSAFSQFHVMRRAQDGGGDGGSSSDGGCGGGCGGCGG
jgi:uncharacterized protein (TIGR04222 family)